MTALPEIQDVDYKRQKVVYLLQKEFEKTEGVPTELDEALDDLIRGHFGMQEGGTYGFVRPKPTNKKNHEVINDSGLQGPKKTPMDFSFSKNDSHIVVNDREETAIAYDFDGNELWKCPALGRGQYGDIDFGPQGDTPPGLYVCGTIYRDYDRVGPNPGYQKDLRSYGWYSIDMEDLENQETGRGRAGIMLHGGGSGNGWPGAWAPKQSLLPTLGCVRMYNQDIKDKVVPLYDKGNLYISVYQEKK